MNIYEAKQAAEIFHFNRLHYFFFHSPDEVTALKSRHLSVSQLPLTIRLIKSFELRYICIYKWKQEESDTFYSFQTILFLENRTRLTDSPLLFLILQVAECLLKTLEPSQSHEWKIRELSPSEEMFSSLQDCSHHPQTRDSLGSLYQHDLCPCPWSALLASNRRVISYQSWLLCNSSGKRTDGNRP